MKKIRNQSLQEGVFFLIAGASLFGYSITSWQSAFNKDWSQSPYLFPILVAAAFALLAVSLIIEGIRQTRIQNQGSEPETGKCSTGQIQKDSWGQVLIILAISLLYYSSMAFLKIPYITFGILSYSFTISTFEIVTVIYLIVMMLYLGVRKPVILILLPLAVTLFLSIAFRTMLHVLLP